jgi:hypothetical protein
MPRLLRSAAPASAAVDEVDFEIPSQPFSQREIASTAAQHPADDDQAWPVPDRAVANARAIGRHR